MSGMFITFEGIEGSGKSTQINKVGDYLTQKGYAVIKTKEPGGTIVGQALRKLILDPETVFKSNHTELLLFYADRHEHIETVIKPALKNGQVVLCDRYIDSTMAYQIGGRNMSESFITTLNKSINLMPHLTLLLDLSVEEGLKRAKARAALDRFEKEDLAFHQRIKDRYGLDAKNDPGRIKKIAVDNLDQDKVFKTCVSYIDKFLETYKGA